MHSSRTALVFGASGQIGQPLLARLRGEGWQVLAVSRQAHADGHGLRWLRGELAHPPALPAAVDAIFSCGPLDHFARWAATSGVVTPRIVAFGSTSVHSKHASDDPGERALALRLQQAEAALFAAAAPHGSAATVLRSTLVYGAGRDASLSRIVAIARRLGGVALPANARGLRQPVHVADLADAAVDALDAAAASGQGYDLPGGETLRYDAMVRRVLSCQQPPLRLWQVPRPLFGAALGLARLGGLARDFGDAAVRRMGEDLVFDATPARRDFGYAPRPFAPTAAMFG